MSNTVQKGDTVTLHYVASFAEGDAYDSTYDRDTPITAVIGEQSLLPAIEEAMIGMEEGEKCTINLTSGEAYGEADPDATLELEKDNFPDDFELTEGTVVPLAKDDGRKFIGTIVEVADTTVTVDINHPLKGKDLQFDIEIVGIATAIANASEGSEATEALEEE